MYVYKSSFTLFSLTLVLTKKEEDGGCCCGGRSWSSSCCCWPDHHEGVCLCVCMYVCICIHEGHDMIKWQAHLLHTARRLAELLPSFFTTLPKRPWRLLRGSLWFARAFEMKLACRCLPVYKILKSFLPKWLYFRPLQPTHHTSCRWLPPCLSWRGCCCCGGL